jgi:hypothetical protein
MSMFRSFEGEVMDYPVFTMVANIGTVDNPNVGSISYSLIRYPATTDADMAGDPDLAEAALFKGLKTFCTTYDWTTIYGAGVTCQSFDIIKFQESQTDVTPA